MTSISRAIKDMGNLVEVVVPRCVGGMWVVTVVVVHMIVSVFLGFCGLQ